MFRQWAERRMYRRSLQLASGLLREAARTPNALLKIEALEQAEQKLKDASWLAPGEAAEEFERSLATIRQSREETLEKHVPAAIERLLAAAESGGEDSGAALEAAGRLLAFLHHYRPHDPRADELTTRLRALGGEQTPYCPVPPLSERYQRPGPGAGCGSAVVALLLGALLLLLAGE